MVSFTLGATTASAILLLQNDDVPEGNETFIVNITGKIIDPIAIALKLEMSNKVAAEFKMFCYCTGTRFGAEVGSVNSLVLFVRGNDEPYGDFQFSTVSPR